MKYRVFPRGARLLGEARFRLRRPTHLAGLEVPVVRWAGRSTKAGVRDYNLAMLPKMTINVKGTTGLLVAAGIIVAVLISFPAYRVFFAISVAVGLVFAALIYLRNKYRPITDKDVENKRPLGLD